MDKGRIDAPGEIDRPRGDGPRGPPPSGRPLAIDNAVSRGQTRRPGRQQGNAGGYAHLARARTVGAAVHDQ